MISRAIAYALAVALAAALGLAGLQTLRLAGEQRDHAETREKHATDLQALSDASRQAEADARAEEQRRTAEVQKAADEAREREAQALADAAAANATGQRLRDRLAALAARGGQAASDPGPATGGPPAGDPIGVLAGVLARADERAGILAQYADAARTAGLACERAYDALTPP